MTAETADIRFIGRIETPYRRIEDGPRNVEPNGPMCKLTFKPEFRQVSTGIFSKRGRNEP